MRPARGLFELGSRAATVLLPALALLFIGCGSSSDTPFNITADWYMYTTTLSPTKAQRGPDTFAFTQSSNTLSGTAADGQSISGSVTGVNVSFTWLGTDGTTTNTFTGSVDPTGKVMSGNWSDTKNNAGTWLADVVLTPSADVSGTWSATFTSTAGTTLPLLSPVTFTQSGTTLTGTTPQGGPTMTGTISGNNVALWWPAPDGEFVLSRGTENSATSMSGSFSITDGNSGTWNMTKN